MFTTKQGVAGASDYSDLLSCLFAGGESYDELQRVFCMTGRGRRPACSDVASTSKLLLQLDLQELTSLPYIELEKSFNLMYSAAL